MAQPFSEGISSLPPQEVLKQRKKQAKRRTKMMLKVHEARKDVQKTHFEIILRNINRLHRLTSIS